MGGADAVVIRAVRRDDLEEWIALRHALWPDQSRESLRHEGQRFFAGALPTLEAVLVADDQAGGLIGFAELSRRAYAEGCETSPVGFLEGWYVAPESRGRGIGRALVRAAEQWARDLGCREFASDTTLDNTASAAAHAALGFEEVEQIRCFRKSLAP